MTKIEEFLLKACALAEKKGKRVQPYARGRNGICPVWAGVDLMPGGQPTALRNYSWMRSFIYAFDHSNPADFPPPSLWGLSRPAMNLGKKFRKAWAYKRGKDISFRLAYARANR